MKEIILKNGWQDLGEQKLKVMQSFKKGKWRLNYYTTTGKITFQNTLLKYDKGNTYSIELLNENTLKSILDKYES